MPGGAGNPSAGPRHTRASHQPRDHSDAPTSAHHNRGSPHGRRDERVRASGPTSNGPMAAPTTPWRCRCGSPRSRADPSTTGTSTLTGSLPPSSRPRRATPTADQARPHAAPPTGTAARYPEAGRARAVDIERDRRPAGAWQMRRSVLGDGVRSDVVLSRDSVSIVVAPIGISEGAGPPLLHRIRSVAVCCPRSAMVASHERCKRLGAQAPG